MFKRKKNCIMLVYVTFTSRNGPLMMMTTMVSLACNHLAILCGTKTKKKQEKKTHEDATSTVTLMIINNIIKLARSVAFVCNNIFHFHFVIVAGSIDSTSYVLYRHHHCWLQAKPRKAQQNQCQYGKSIESSFGGANS